MATRGPGGRPARRPPRPASPPAPPPEEAPPQEGGDAGSPAPPPGAIPLDEILGIGPSTAERLRGAGVADVAVLAGLSDERLEELRIRASWREQARAMAAGE